MPSWSEYLNSDFDKFTGDWEQTSKAMKNSWGYSHGVGPTYSQASPPGTPPGSHKQDSKKLPKWIIRNRERVAKMKPSQIPLLDKGLTSKRRAEETILKPYPHWGRKRGTPAYCSLPVSPKEKKRVHKLIVNRARDFMESIRRCWSQEKNWGQRKRKALLGRRDRNTSESLLRWDN